APGSAGKSQSGAEAGGRVKPAAFDYVRPRDVGEALTALRAPDAKPIAGGQSLGPMLNLPLARPKLLVDVSKIEDLKQTKEEGEGRSRRWAPGRLGAPRRAGGRAPRGLRAAG